MVDRYFGNDSLEPFESKFIGSTRLAMAYLWLSWPSLMGGTRPFSNMWEFCEVLLVVGGFILFSLHMTMVWDLTNGAGIPAPSDAIDVCVCVSKHQSALIRGDGDSSSTTGPKALGLGHRADEQKLLFA